MAGDAEVRLPVAELMGQARTVQVESAELRSWSAVETSRSRALRSQLTAVRSRSQALMSQWVAVTSQAQALRSRPVDNQALVTRRDRAAARVFVSPASVRVRVTLTYRELAAVTRRQAIARARESGLLDG